MFKCVGAMFSHRCAKSVIFNMFPKFSKNGLVVWVEPSKKLKLESFEPTCNAFGELRRVL